MKIADFLSKKAITADLKAVKKEDVLKELGLKHKGYANSATTAKFIGMRMPCLLSRQAIPPSALGKNR